jgi:acyl dehydratase
MTAPELAGYLEDYAGSFTAPVHGPRLVNLAYFLNVNWDFTAPVRPGDVITGRVEVIEARTDKPVTKLRTTVIRGDGTIALTGTAVCYTMAIEVGTDPG